VTPRVRRLAAELLGTAALLAVVVGSGVMGMTLSPSNAGIALLANAAATGSALFVLIVVLGPISGAHFNPAVTLAMRLRGEMRTGDAVAYVLVQGAGAIAGVVLAHAMFDLPLLQAGTQVRTGIGQWLSEAIATAGLLLTILLSRRTRADALPALVGAWVFAAYWFNASTAFANPAVTLARALTDTFAGIRGVDVPAFVAAQLAGVVIALSVERLLVGDARATRAVTDDA
jgi:glycerol uptake facilitator-like aquaporin